jgi:NADH-quinone oxidoreductase subunit C
MSDINQDLAARIEERFAADVTSCTVACGEVTAVIASSKLLDVAKTLRDDPDFAFEILIDLCGVDYGHYGVEEWEQTEHTTYNRIGDGEADEGVTRPSARFAVVYHLLSVSRNQRLRLKVLLADEPPRVNSVVDIWNCANWFEREAFDLFGILFDGHPDLRRLLTDYGFIGHPFRKDFPLIGNVEMRYDPDKRRVVYEPVSIEPRVLVPRVIRHDSRYEGDVPDLTKGGRNG